MSTNSAIGWTDATWNPVVGCTRVNSDCDNCYAVRVSHRLERMGKTKYAGLTVLNNAGKRHFNGVVRECPDTLSIPLKWRKPRRIFVNSMSDLFHNDISWEFVARVMAVIMQCPQHHFTVLTKRPESAWFFFKTFETLAPPNLELGVSAGTQEHYDKMFPDFITMPAIAFRSLSLEPLRGPIVIGPSRRYIQRVYVGCESKGAHLGRECKLEWVEQIVQECRSSEIPCFVKQIGVDGKLLKHEPGEPWPDAWPEPLRVQQLTEVSL